MRKILLLIIILSLNSCGQNEEIIKRDELYKKGIGEIKLVILGESPDYKNAINYFNQSLKIDPSFSAASYQKSDCEIKSELYTDAIKTTDKAIKLNNKNKFSSLLYIISGISLKINGESERANRQFNKAIEIYEKEIKYSFNIFDSKRYDKKISAIMNKSIVLCYLDKKDEALIFLSSIPETKENERFIEEQREYIREFEFDEFIKKMKLIK